MVGWTEQEIGHWLDDTQLQRELIELIAFQIHPTADRRDAAQERVEVERGDLNSRRQWFAALRDFCQQRSSVDERELLDDAVGEAAAARGQPVGLCGRSGPRRTRRDDDRRAAEPDQAGAWRAWTREAFVREHLDPLWETPAAPGLNRQFPGLRLPVSFPHARAWAASYALVTFGHSAMLVLAACGLVWLLVRRGLASRSATLATTAAFWHSAAALGVVVFLVLYCW